VKAVFASRNRHKIEQVAILLPEVDLVPVDDVAPELELAEPFATFEANALAKARAAAGATRLPSIADDSGLEVDALGGAPGVLSALYAGEGASDADNNARLVRELEAVREGQRTARYRCVAVMVTPEGEEIVAEGSCEGRVILEGRGDLGFGYDPHFVPDGETRTMGEIPLDEKLAFSHRGRAFRALSDLLRNAGHLARDP
jgi:XTP/dITP diphosphohydrolase